MENELDIKNLKIITNIIFDHLIDDLNFKKIEIKKDGYWEVPTDKLYNLEKDPISLDIGRLSDDWKFLSKILEDKDQAVAFMFVHLAPILRYIGEKVGK